MISPLEAIALRRADEQMGGINMGEPVKHDGWAIKPSDVQGRADGRGKGYRPAHCRACDRKATHGTYCKRHWARVRVGLPVDADLYTLTGEERRRLSSGIRFGGRIQFASRSVVERGQ